MFSMREKREISERVQEILRQTGHPELPGTEIQFHLHVNGAQEFSCADIKNNGSAEFPGRNEWNETCETEKKL